MVEVRPGSLQTFMEADLGPPAEFSLDLSAIQIGITRVPGAPWALPRRHLVTRDLYECPEEGIDARAHSCADIVGLTSACVQGT